MILDTEEDTHDEFEANNGSNSEIIKEVEDMSHEVEQMLKPSASRPLIHTI
jgi:hypothetical protein